MHVRGILNSMPDAFRYEDCRAFFKGPMRFAHDGDSSAFLNDDDLVLLVLMDRNAGTALEMLSSHSHAGRAFCGSTLITMLPPGRTIVSPSLALSTYPWAAARCASALFSRIACPTPSATRHAI